MRMTLEDAYDLFDDMTLNAFNWQSERHLKRPVGVQNIDSQAALTAQVNYEPSSNMKNEGQSSFEPQVLNISTRLDYTLIH